jgi:hypothetical protein
MRCMTMYAYCGLFRVKAGATQGVRWMIHSQSAAAERASAWCPQQTASPRPSPAAVQAESRSRPTHARQTSISARLPHPTPPPARDFGIPIYRSVAVVLLHCRHTRILASFHPSNFCNSLAPRTSAAAFSTCTPCVSATEAFSQRPNKTLCITVCGETDITPCSLSVEAQATLAPTVWTCRTTPH